MASLPTVNLCFLVCSLLPWAFVWLGCYLKINVWLHLNKIICRLFCNHMTSGHIGLQFGQNASCTRLEIIICHSLHPGRDVIRALRHAIDPSRFIYNSMIASNLSSSSFGSQSPHLNKRVVSYFPPYVSERFFEMFIMERIQKRIQRGIQISQGEKNIVNFRRNHPARFAEISYQTER